MRSIVVIPTYNERNNIGPIIDAVLALDIPDLSILVVDDSSPDGTGTIAQRIAEKNPRVRLLTRPKKEGLGRAYVAGFQEAVQHGAEAVVEMDADFSHDPNDLPRFLWHLERADVVVGSRYLHDGRVQDWSPLRRWISRGGNVYARLVTGIPFTDLTSGFVAWRTALFPQMNLGTIQTDGYGFQIEMKTRAHRAGARVAEIPIVFEDRRVGKSKFSKQIIWEATWLVWRLRFEKGAEEDIDTTPHVR